MKETKVNDLQWTIKVTWSAPEKIFTVTLDRWERDTAAYGWQLEGSQTAPVVVPHRVARALREVMDALAAEVEDATGAPIDPF